MECLQGIKKATLRDRGWLFLLKLLTSGELVRSGRDEVLFVAADQKVQLSHRGTFEGVASFFIQEIQVHFGTISAFYNSNEESLIRDEKNHLR